MGAGTGCGVGLGMSADDYVAESFAAHELLLRVKTVQGGHMMTAEMAAGR